MEIKDIPILRTMIGGKFVYTNPNQDPNQEVRYWDPGNWDPRPELWVKLDVPQKQ